MRFFRAKSLLLVAVVTLTTLSACGTWTSDPQRSTTGYLAADETLVAGREITTTTDSDMLTVRIANQKAKDLPGLALSMGPGSWSTRPCGSGWSSYIVPEADLFTLMVSLNTYQNFEEACLAHDECYGTCGKAKERCEDEFLGNLKSACRGTYGIFCSFMSPCSLCKQQAEVYAWTVSEAGGSAYANAQAKACARYKVHRRPYRAVCIKNQTDRTITYGFRWRPHEWEYKTLLPNWWEVYSYNVDAGHDDPTPYIAFDSDLTEGMSVTEYWLKTRTREIQPTDCGHGRIYEFIDDGLEAKLFLAE